MNQCASLISILRHLNYPKPIKSDSFKAPNFELVADVLCYLVLLVDSTIPIHDSIGSVEDRIQFVNGITAELFVRLHLSLDGRRLYSANGYAVQELFKLAQYIKVAVEMFDEESSCTDDAYPTAGRQAEAQAMAAEISALGASIQNLMNREVVDSSERSNATQLLSNDSEMQSIGENINQLLNQATNEVERLDKQCKMLISNNKGMEEKIRKRSIDLERNTKRLESLTLENARPSFMDEYEQIEKELQVEYDRYVVRFRNIDYLESELRSRMDVADKRADAAERSAKRMQRKYREEELRVLEGGDEFDDDPTHRQSSNDNTRGKENSKPRENMT